MLDQKRGANLLYTLNTHTQKDPDTHSQTYRNALASGFARYLSSTQGQDRPASTLRWECGLDPVHSWTDKVKQHCVYMCFPLCCGSFTAWKMSSALEHVYVCPIEVLMSQSPSMIPLLLGLWFHHWILYPPCTWPYIRKKRERCDSTISVYVSTCACVYESAGFLPQTTAQTKGWACIPSPPTHKFNWPHALKEHSGNPWKFWGKDRQGPSSRHHRYCMHKWNITCSLPHIQKAWGKGRKPNWIWISFHANPFQLLSWLSFRWNWSCRFKVQNASTVIEHTQSSLCVTYQTSRAELCGHSCCHSYSLHSWFGSYGD